MPHKKNVVKIENHCNKKIRLGVPSMISMTSKSEQEGSISGTIVQSVYECVARTALAVV